MEKLDFETDFDHWRNTLEARTNLLRFEGKIKDEDVEAYKLNLAFVNVSAELTSRIDSEKRQSYKTFLSKLQSVWASGKNGISPSHLNQVDSLEEWLAFLRVSKRLQAVGYSVATIYTLLLERMTDHSVANLLQSNFKNKQPKKLDEIDEFLRGIRFDSATYKPGVAGISKKRIKCFNCNKFGHYARQCFKQCNSCTDLHQRRNCPRFPKNDASPSSDQ